MFNKIFYITFALGLLIKTLVIGCEYCVERLEERQRQFESYQQACQENSIDEAYYKGAAMGVRSAISLYTFNHIDPRALEYSVTKTIPENKP